MILFNGTIYPTSEQSRLLNAMEETINATLSEGRLSQEAVIRAIDRLGGMLRAGELDRLIEQSGLADSMKQMKGFSGLLSREYLTYKLRTELGDGFFEPWETSAVYGLAGVSNIPMPLGTLFHIAAGNMDALPAYTVVEGLLTGNVNILKLPQADNGLTMAALEKLIEIEPSLAGYIYVFDTPSTDIAAMRRLAGMADGIVVWGGDAAVSAVRAMAPAGVRLIEWGHRLSFAYLSGNWRVKKQELASLAEHIVTTEQVLCSSCQTIFLDTDSMDEIEKFCGAFLPMLQTARDVHPLTEIGAAAEITLKNYTAELEAAIAGHNRKRNPYAGRILLKKRLPRARMMSVLRRKKGTLQTAGLICDDGDRAALTDRLIRCGVNRVTSAGNMSAGFSGESHDGEYSLRRYVRIANAEYTAP